MANTIRWYDEKWNMVHSATIGTDALIEDVHTDGDGNYWIVDQTADTLECYQLEAGAFSRTKSYNLTGYSNPWGMTGDSNVLYVGVVKTSGFPVVQNNRVIQVDKTTGTILKEINAGNTLTTTDTCEDLTFDGMNLLMVRTVSSVPQTRFIDTIDVSSDKVVHTTASLGRAVDAMAFDGHNLKAAVLVSGSSRGMTIDRDGRLIEPGTVSLPQLAYGMAFVSNQKGLPLKFFSGQLVAAAHRA